MELKVTKEKKQKDGSYETVHEIYNPKNGIKDTLIIFIYGFSLLSPIIIIGLLIYFVIKLLFF